jgi:PAS domain S-box-containing protein
MAKPVRAQPTPAATAPPIGDGRPRDWAGPGTWFGALLRPVGYTGVVYIVYIIAHLTGVRAASIFSVEHLHVSAMYPPAALCFLLPLVYGPRFAPAIFLAGVAEWTFVAEETIGAAHILAYAVSVSGTYTAAAVLARRLRVDVALRRARDVAWFLALGTLVAPLPLGLFQSANFVLAGLFPWSDYLLNALIYWAGDATGVAAIAPLLLVARRELPRLWERRRSHLQLLPSYRRALVKLATFLGAAAICVWAAFALSPGASVDLTYLLFLPPLWVAVRQGFDLATLAIALLIVTSAIIVVTQVGKLDEVAFQFGLMSVSVGTLLVGAAVRDDREHRRELATAEHFRRLFNSVPAPLFSFDQDGTVSVVNDVWSQLLGISSHEAVGRPITSFATEDGARVLRTKVIPALAHEDEIRDVQCQFRTRPGGVVDTLLNVRTERDVAGGFAWASASVVDVTEARRREQELRQAQRMEATGLLAAGISHDFNNYLTIIVGNLDMMSASVRDSPRLLRLVENTLAAAGKAERLIRQLLAFSRKQPLEPRNIDVGELLKQTARLLQQSFSPQIDIVMELASDLWQATVDPGHLETALVNLAMNARDAMHDGGRIIMRGTNECVAEGGEAASQGLAPGRYIRLAVSDSGRGMPPEVAAHAFEPFFTTKSKDRGTGLGLSQVYGFVRQSGGHVWLASPPGGGTTVTMYLPAASEPVQLPPAAMTRAPTRLPRGAETILVVEDDRDVRDLATSMLTGFGYTVVEAANADEALKIVNLRDDIDLMFSDVVMPGSMDGIELAAAVAKRNPRMCIVLTSGYHKDFQGTEASTRCLLVKKPYRARELSALFRELLDAREPPT